MSDNTKTRRRFSLCCCGDSASKGAAVGVSAAALTIAAHGIDRHNDGTEAGLIIAIITGAALLAVASTLAWRCVRRWRRRSGAGFDDFLRGDDAGSND